MTEDTVNTQLDALKLRIPYDSAIHGSQEQYEQILTDLLEDTKFKCLSLLFPFENYADYELPERYNNWQLRASVELYNLADKISIKDYSENGLRWSRFNDGLSQNLLDEIVSKVGILEDTGD